MDTKQYPNDATADMPTREIPTPPGGGSWIFDEALWKWISNDSTPVPPAAAGDDVANTNTEQE